MHPLDISPLPAFRLFTGQVSIEQFVQDLSDEQLDTFLDRYPALQAAHQARIDSGEIR